MFRVWAPHAEAVFVTGTFDDWAGDRTALARDGDGTSGTWSADVAGVAPGRRVPVHDPHRRTATCRGSTRMRRHVTSSVGNSIVYDPAAFDWGDDAVPMPTWDDLVIYEMHVGTFAPTGDRRGHLRRCARAAALSRATSASRRSRSCRRSSSRATSRGATTRPTCSPSSPATAGPDAFKRFIREAHAHGIAVIVDVVYNHLGPSDLDLWRFDGWAEGDGGGIYFYNDERARDAVGRDPPGLRSRRGPHVPARQRDDLARGVPVRRPPVRCHGLHPDRGRATRQARIGPLPDGWSFLAWINDEIRARQPWKITIAEDLEDDPILVTPTADGRGAGFGAQWDVGFIRRVRPALEVADDADRDMEPVAAAIVGDGSRRRR